MKTDPLESYLQVLKIEVGGFMFYDVRDNQYYIMPYELL